MNVYLTQFTSLVLLLGSSIFVNGAIAQQNPRNLVAQTPMNTQQIMANALPLNGEPVYVLDASNHWQEADLTGVLWSSFKGYTYSVQFRADNTILTGVLRDRIQTLAEAQQSGMAKQYDLSTQKGIDEMLAAQNAWRSQVGVKPLKWSAKIAAFAQEWADHLMAEKIMQHRPDNDYGENLISSTNKYLSPEAAVNQWGNERRNYDYATNSCPIGKVCGHYTQMVWRDSTEVGCGMARSGQLEIWVCNYNPPGNYIGEKPY